MTTTETTAVNLLMLTTAITSLLLGWIAHWLFSRKVKRELQTEILELKATLQQRNRQGHTNVPAPNAKANSAICKLLEQNGFHVTSIRDIAYGVQFRLATGSIVNQYSSGKITIQGRDDKNLSKILGL